MTENYKVEITPPEHLKELFEANKDILGDAEVIIRMAKIKADMEAVA